MNSYYHEFVPGFNWWYVIAVLFVVVMAAIGLGSRYMDADLKIKRRYNIAIANAFAIVFAIVVAALVFHESFAGLVQFFGNGLSKYESPFYSWVCAFIAILAFGTLCGIVYMAVGKVAAWAKHGYLVEKRAEMRKQEQKENPRA